MKLQVLAVLAVARAFAPPSQSLRTPLALGPTTKSGIVYEDTVVGTGRTPGPGDAVTVVYQTTLNGKVVDEKNVGAAAKGTGDFKTRGLPWAQFIVGRGKVIAGWDEAIQTMKEGGTREMTIPADLAFGAKGSPDGLIPPGSDLDFTVELVSIDSNAGIAGGMGKAIAFVMSGILLNGAAVTLTGHEIREYLTGAV